MADDRYTRREKAIVTILTPALGPTYLVSRGDSFNLGAGTHKYNVLVQWTDSDNGVLDGNICYKTDRNFYRILCAPLSGQTDTVAGTQLNKMADEVITALRNYTLTNATTIGAGDKISEIRVESAKKGYLQNRLMVNITFSFLVDE